jgi:ElaB/YqjD/DUF883 family membrane-anchored ribosome-binding protein
MKNLMKNKDELMKELEEKLDKYSAKLSKIKSIATTKLSGNESVQSKIENTQGKLKEAYAVYENLKEASADDWQELKKSSSKAVEALKDSFHEIMNGETKDQLSSVKDEIWDFGEDKLHELEKQLKEKPFASAAFALGVGFVLGRFFSWLK